MTDLSVSSLAFQKSIKDVSSVNQTTTLNIFSKIQCGFRKGFSVVSCLLPMKEKWRQPNNQGGTFGVLLIDLSKAFDCLLHNLMIAKFHTYGLDMSSQRLTYSYLSNWKRRVKQHDTCSSQPKILFGVLQGFILGALLFNIFICGLFFFV